jgi:hypothetical protein
LILYGFIKKREGLKREGLKREGLKREGLKGRIKRKD